MRTILRKTFLALASVAMGLCLLFGCVFAFSQTKASAASALETEFTNNGQFTVSEYNAAVPFEYADGASEGLPAGYTGSVLKIETKSGVAYTTLDFSASNIKASDVESIVVRIYSPDFTIGTDEFRTNVAVDGSNQVQYGKNTYDISTWCDVTLNAASMATMTDANGNLALISVGVRERDESKTIYYYIDRITVNIKVDREAEFTSNGQFVVSNYLDDTVNYPYEFVDGASEGLPAGYTGSVLKVSSKAAGGAPYVNLDFTASKISASKVESVVARVYSPDYTAADELRINNASGSVGGAGAHDLSTWCDVELPLATITGADGCLGSFAFGLRDKGTVSDYFYIDSITVNMKEAVPTTKVTLTDVHGWWNNYFHDNTYCSILNFSGGIQKGNLLADYSDIYAKATLNDQPIDTANLSFICRAWIDGGTDSIVMRWVTLPEAGSILHIPAGAKFVNGSEDPNVYEFAEDVYLQYNGTTWAKIADPTKLEKASFHSIWGNADMYNSTDRVLLQYNSTTAWDHTNKGDLASKVTYVNTESGATMSATNANIAGWEGQRWIIFTGMANYDKLVIAEGGTFGGVEIPALTIYKVNGLWVTTAPNESVTTNYKAIAGGWNNATSYDANLGQTIVSFDVNPLGSAADQTNLAAKTNRTSLMVKYNGKTFRELYASNPAYAISYAHGNNHFYFAIPAADFVEGAIFEIEEGTPFAGQSLGAVKLVLKNGAWEVIVEKNLTPDFVELNKTFNNDEHGFFIIDFNANSWAQNAVPSSYTGITYNGEDIGSFATIQFFQTYAIWFNYGGHKDKLVAGYNNYSHPTIHFEEGATVVYEGDTYTFQEMTFYLDFTTNKWTTEKPADYEIKEEVVVVPELGTPNCLLNSIGPWNNEGGITLLEFSDFLNKPTQAVNCTATTGYYITLNGVQLSQIAGTKVYTWENTYWLRLDIPNPTEGSVLIIEEGTPFEGNYLPRIVLKFVNGLWHEAFTVQIEIDSEVLTLYSQNDVPVVLNDEYFEALLADRSIPGKVVSFSTRGVTYPAGTEFDVLTDTYLTVKTIGFNTTDGASVRLKTPTGIRYETKINKADYDKLIALYGEGNVETGTYIVPSYLLDTTDFRSYFADSTHVDGSDYVQVANKDTVDTDGYYLYYGSLVELQPHNYCTEFFGIGYIKITDGDNVYVVYGGYDLDTYTRSIYYVSAHAYNDYEEGSTQKAILKSYLDSVVYITDNAKISSVIQIAGYSSPYSISYDSQTGVYTVTGNAEIKSVMIGDKKKFNARTSTLKVGGAEYYITDYNLTATAAASTITFKLSPVVDPLTLVDFALEVPSNRGVKILQISDTELTDATQMRTANSLSAAEQEEYARKNIYANCFNYITQLVEQDRPDLIILTGDSVNGLFDDNGTIWLRFIEFMDSLDIPWAIALGTLEGESAKGTAWQRAQLAAAKNCLFKTDKENYTIGITDNGVLRRVIYLLHSGVSQTQTAWMKGVASNVEAQYGNVPAFAFYSKTSETSFASDFALANVDGVFMGNSHNDNSTTVVDGISYTYGTKTGTYGAHSEAVLGGTYITISANSLEFAVSVEYLDKTEMKNKEILHLVETYDGSSVVNDAYLAPIWDTDRIYDESSVFVGETGSVTLMYTPSDPKEVVVRDITLGVTYTYGLDYTISGNKVTRVAGGSLPYVSYEEYYRKTPVRWNGVEQGWRVDRVEDDYSYSGTRYMNYAEAYNGVARYVTFTYDKTEAWTGTTIVGDSKAQSFIEKLKTDKEGTILFYGDSITVGCNASGTPYGGNRNPFLPAWNDLVTNSLENLYGAKIDKYNAAVGGWTTAQGAENLSAKVSEAGTSLASVDLFVIAFGMNDPVTKESSYTASIKQMIDAYYAANPNGSVLLVSPMQPNTQSEMVSGNQKLWENALSTVKNAYSGKNVALAKVFSIFNELITVSGKLSRDYLGNNINHPTDFGVRIYAQVILKTLCGDDFA